MSEDRHKSGPARARALRLESELRANLKKRKQLAKSRARSETPEASPVGNPPEDRGE